MCDQKAKFGQKGAIYNTQIIPEPCEALLVVLLMGLFEVL